MFIKNFKNYLDIIISLSRTFTVIKSYTVELFIIIIIIILLNVLLLYLKILVLIFNYYKFV
jgi:hypothetical protein